MTQGPSPDDGASGRAAGGAAVAVAVLVLLGWLALVGAWVALLLLDEGLSRIVWAVLGVLVFWHLRPRPPRVRRLALAVDEQQAPGLHALAAAVAEAVGCHRPRRVLLDTTYPVTGPAGRLQRAARTSSSGSPSGRCSGPRSGWRPWRRCSPASRPSGARRTRSCVSRTTCSSPPVSCSSRREPYGATRWRPATA